jgi:hypothetical protein
LRQRYRRRPGRSSAPAATPRPENPVSSHRRLQFALSVRLDQADQHNSCREEAFAERLGGTRFGTFYLGRALIRRPVPAGGPPLELAEPSVSHAAAFWGLVAVMALSPGEVLLPIYLSQAGEGLAVLAALTVALSRFGTSGPTTRSSRPRTAATFLSLRPSL